MKKAFRNGKLRFHGDLEPLVKPPAFQAMCEKAAKIEWVVYAKRPFGGPQQVLKYLARYTHRVAISNSRLLSLEQGWVTFQWKDYADGNTIKKMTLEAVEFIRRFLLHVLPTGFVHIRHFGFLANRLRKEKLALCRSMLTSQPLTPTPATPSSSGDSTTEEQVPRLCPICKAGRLIFVEIIRAEKISSFATPILQDTS